jgi:hypothetical protein
MRKYIMRLEVHFNKTDEIFSVEFASDEEHGIEFNTNSSIDALPSAQLGILLNDKNSELFRLKSCDRISVISIEEVSKTESILFNGEIVRLELVSKRDSGTKISITALSPFYKLQETYLDYELFKDILGLRATLRNIKAISEVWGDIIVGADVVDDFTIGDMCGYSAFSLLKDISMQKDLTLQFKGADLLIEKRSTVIENMKREIPKKLNMEDVLEMKLNK